LRREEESMQTSALTKAPSSLAVVDPKGRGGKYLVLHLGTEEFATEVLKVREIVGLQVITSVPLTPPFVKGVINLRGKVIPVVDLRLKFGLEPEEYTQRTCIIVITTKQADEDLLIGMIVDGVAEVLTLTDSDIEDTPDFGAGTAVPYLKGMAKIKGKVKILLDADQLVCLGEMAPGAQPGSEKALAAANVDLRLSA